MSVNALSRKKNQLSKIEQLELENQEMEERLRNFRESMAREKAKRSFSGKTNGDKPASSIWITGESKNGSLSKYASDVLQKKKNKGYAGIGLQLDAAVKSLQERSSENHFLEPSTSPSSHIEKMTKSNLIPVPPSAEIPPSHRNRIWRVPTAMKIHGNDMEELPKAPSPKPPSSQPRFEYQEPSSTNTGMQNSLLNGDEFDPEASHQSFLEALRQWRGESGPTEEQKQDQKPPLPIPPTKNIDSSPQYYHRQRPQTPGLSDHFYSTNSSISTETNTFKHVEETKPEIQFEFRPSTALSYFDRLRLQKGYATPLLVEEMKTSEDDSVAIEKEVNQKEEHKEAEDEWDQEDEELFLQILNQKKQNSEHVQENQENQENNEIETQEIEHLMDMDPNQIESKERCLLIMQDITGFEDDAIMKSLDAGIMVECIPTTKLKIVFPDEADS